mmetsp:Transcript_9658/g.28554  ORF Transcript_9658/g.28554 Transcript_9658/m.28554 type:complete len:250 (+) Transcript_9658:944-1693(+)
MPCDLPGGVPRRDQRQGAGRGPAPRCAVRTGHASHVPHHGARACHAPLLGAHPGHGRGAGHGAPHFCGGGGQLALRWLRRALLALPPRGQRLRPRTRGAICERVPRPLQVWYQREVRVRWEHLGHRRVRNHHLRHQPRSAPHHLADPRGHARLLRPRLHEPGVQERGQARGLRQLCARADRHPGRRRGPGLWESQVPGDQPRDARASCRRLLEGGTQRRGGGQAGGPHHAARGGRRGGWSDLSNVCGHV